MKIKTNYTLFFIVMGSVLMYSCSSDDSNTSLDDFVVGFKNPSEDFSNIDNQKKVWISFSEAAPENGSVFLNYTTKNLAYGQENDFITKPPGEEGKIEIPIKKDSSSTAFRITKSTQALPGDEKAIHFSIDHVEFNAQSDLISTGSGGNTTTKVNFSESASLGGEIKPKVGGPNEPYQVYVSLKSKEQTQVKRDSWDLGFYAGEESRVKLNSSLKMFAGETQFKDIDKVTSEDVADLKPKMELLSSGSDQFVDDPGGDIHKTAIDEIASEDTDNPVYLINLGNKVGTQTPETGSVAVDQGDPDQPEKGKRGWMKVRILEDGESYVMQYANLDESTHHEVIIAKDPSYNFVFFNFEDQGIVDVEPPKEDWDLNFTTFTNTLDLPGDYGGGQSAYGYSDFVVTNNLAGVKAYQVSTDDISYADFSEDEVDLKKLDDDQRVVGDEWRNVFEKAPTTGVFYILRDAQGNDYKLKFTAMVNKDGERGYPAFEYALLQ